MSEPVVCPVCRGHGKVEDFVSGVAGDDGVPVRQCHACAGTGVVQYRPTYMPHGPYCKHSALGMACLCGS